MIIGELINSSRKTIKPLVERYDEAELLKIARTEAQPMCPTRLQAMTMTTLPARRKN